MTAKNWGIIAIIISIIMWALLAWAWLIVALPDSNIWDECQDYFGTVLVLNASMISGEIAWFIIVFFVPISILSLISNISLIRMRKAYSYLRY